MLRQTLIGRTCAMFVMTAIMSCSDDTPRPVDAGRCTYPTPIVVRDDRPDQTGGGLTAEATCPPGTNLLGGGCEVGNGQGDLLQLIVAGARGPVNAHVYRCVWANPLNTITEVIAWATCLPIE